MRLRLLHNTRHDLACNASCCTIQIYQPKGVTEKNTRAVTLWTCIVEVTGSNLRWATKYIDWYRIYYLRFEVLTAVEMWIVFLLGCDAV
jgi:hypothetical protein